VVVGVILTTVMGGYLVAGALSEPAGAPVGFPGVVRLRPLSGWGYAGEDTSGGIPYLRLTRGNGNLDVVAIAGYGGDASSLARDYVDQILDAQLERLRVSDRFEQVRGPNGLSGTRFTYVGVVADTGSSIEGEVTAVVSPDGDGVVFDAWAPEGLLSFIADDVRTMIDGAEVA
jgi:hypothetical protein